MRINASIFSKSSQATSLEQEKRTPSASERAFQKSDSRPATAPHRLHLDANGQSPSRRIARQPPCGYRRDMAHRLPSYIGTVRRMLLAVLAIALALPMGGVCEAQAAMLAHSVAEPACADMPKERHHPVKAASIDCALCVALPGPAAAPDASVPFIAIIPVAGLASRLAGLSGGPAPPPPRIV